MNLNFKNTRSSPQEYFRKNVFQNYATNLQENIRDEE